MDKTDFRIVFRRVSCDFRDKCTSNTSCCDTCLRNKANNYCDKFSLEKGGYKIKF